MIKIFDEKLIGRQKVATTLLQAAIERNKLANAYLLTGKNIDDKYILAKQIACFLNCTAQNGTCFTQHACQNCRWIDSGQHPQAWIPLTSLESKSGKIAVEKVRALVNDLGKTTPFYRAVIIPQASQDSLHRPAANAILKTLEEPGSSTVFFLFANQMEDVLPTIVSRCQIVPIIQAEIPDLETQHLPPAFEAPCARGQNLYHCLNWLANLNTILLDRNSPAEIIDTVLSKELGQLKHKAIEDPLISLYLNQLIMLAERAKEQIDHFIQPRFAIESFVIAWQKLAARVGP